jgi:hypothetical protein
MSVDAMLASPVLTKFDKFEGDSDVEFPVMGYPRTSTYFGEMALVKQETEALQAKLSARAPANVTLVSIGELNKIPTLDADELIGCGELGILGLGALNRQVLKHLLHIPPIRLDWSKSVFLTETDFQPNLMDALSGAVVSNRYFATLYIHNRICAISNRVRADQTQVVSDALKANWLELSQSRLSDVAFARLQKIAEKRDGWRGPGSLALSAASLSQFLMFWHEIRGEKTIEPELMLTPRGTLQAEWHRSYRQFFEIEFTKERGVGNFGLIDMKSRIEGAMPVKEIVKLVKNYRDGIALTWASN